MQNFGKNNSSFVASKQGRPPSSSSDILSFSVAIAGSAVASLYQFGVDITGGSTSELKDDSLSSIPGLEGVKLEDDIKLALAECATSRLLDGAADSMWDAITAGVNWKRTSS